MKIWSAMLHSKSYFLRVVMLMLIRFHLLNVMHTFFANWNIMGYIHIYTAVNDSIKQQKWYFICTRQSGNYDSSIIIFCVIWCVKIQLSSYFMRIKSRSMCVRQVIFPEMCVLFGSLMPMAATVVVVLICYNG